MSKKTKNLGGRPTKLTQLVREKLYYAASIGCSDSQICLYAGIAKPTLYEWKAADPELANRLDELKENPVLKARETINRNLNKPDTAKWLLERKCKDEFGSGSSIKGSLNDMEGKPLFTVNLTTDEAPKQ